MELWWWVGPLFKSSMVWLLIFGLITFFAAAPGREKLVGVLALIALLPLASAIGVVLVWFIFNAFYLIWAPYL